MKTRLELFIVCQNPACRKRKRVRGRREQQRQKFCSQRCNGKVNHNVAGSGKKGGLEAGRRRQRAVLARVAGLSPIQAFRLGYQRGLQSKLRQIRRHYLLERISA